MNLFPFLKVKRLTCRSNKHPLEIEEILGTMTILVDTREQRTERSLKRYKQFGVDWERRALDYGDYTFQCISDGKPLFPDDSEKVKSPCVIERKMNLDELAQCFTRERQRFKAEFERAKENHARVYLLVEDASWENLINGRYRSKYNSVAFLASILAWQVRYDMKIIFCKPETSGRLIKEILYRELKERLMHGEMEL